MPVLCGRRAFTRKRFGRAPVTVWARGWLAGWLAHSLVCLLALCAQGYTQTSGWKFAGTPVWAPVLLLVFDVLLIWHSCW